MFKSFGLPEMMVFLVIILLVFGVGRIGKIAGELGEGIRAFKEGLSGKKDMDAPQDDKDSSAPDEEE